jgi:hypothetical protein
MQDAALENALDPSLTSKLLDKLAEIGEPSDPVAARGS